MAGTSQRMDVMSCEKVMPPHPCDPPVTCDPKEEPKGACPKPFLCLERLKNPALPFETTRCRPGSFLNVRSCAKEEFIHPCDPLPICNPNKKKKRPCSEPPLCMERIKNQGPKGIKQNCRELEPGEAMPEEVKKK